MTGLRLTFRSVNLERSLDFCLECRRDAHRISFGNDNKFSEHEVAQWYKYLSIDNPNGFLHVMSANEIIGQLEFKAVINIPDGESIGYINLFYLQAKWRGLGLGQQMHDFVVNELSDKGATQAQLRYIPGNHIAEHFYLKNGWIAEGKADERGQLMLKSINNHHLI